MLCRIYKKNNSQAERLMMESEKDESFDTNAILSMPLPMPARNINFVLGHNDNSFDGSILPSSSRGTNTDHHNQQPGTKRSLPTTSFHGDLNRGGSTGGVVGGGAANARINDTFVSMLSHIQQQSSGTTASFHSNAMLLGSSQFQLPPTDMSWNS